MYIQSVMKKASLQNKLELNKKVVSNFNTIKITGGSTEEMTLPETQWWSCTCFPTSPTLD